MQTYLNIVVNDKTGNLEITATSEGIEYLQDQIETSSDIQDAMGNYRVETWKRDNVSMWCDMLESYSCNGSYNLSPENYFALTTAPIIASLPGNWESKEGVKYDKFTYDDPATKFWFFNEYAIKDEFDILLSGGTVVFQAVEEDKEISPAMATVLNELIQIENVMTLRKCMRDKDFTTYSEDEIIAEFQRREDARPKPLNATQQLEFILANNPEDEKYDIDKIYQSSYCKALTRQLPYTHFSNGQNYLLTKYKVDFTKSIAEEVTRFENYVISKGISIDDFKLYYYHSGLFTSHYFRAKKEGKGDQYSASEKAYTGICTLVQFLTDGGIYYPNLSVANAFLDSHKIGYFTGAYEYTIGNITVKKFQNGRIDLKGLTQDQQKVIDRLFYIHEVLKNG